MSGTDNVHKLIRPEIQALAAYQVPDAAGMVKLDAMENPYRLPEALRREWLDRLSEIPINRYPDPRSQEIKDRLRATMNIPARCDILLGNGSDELIQMLCLAVSQADRAVMAPEPSFVMYGMLAVITRLFYQGVPLKPDFSLNLAAMLEALQKHKPALVFLAQPNNPTGNLFHPEQLKAVAGAAPGLVVVDEAYTPFCDSDCLPLNDEYDNVLIMRTLSKVGLAGLRLGMLIGRPHWIAELEKIRLPYNINVLTQASAAFALDHFEIFTAQARQIRNDRSVLFDALQAFSRLEVFPSDANFILVRVVDNDARTVFSGLKARGVLVKCLDGAHPLLAGCLRITVGTPEENERFLQALREVL